MMKAYIVATTNPDAYGYDRTYTKIAYAENIADAAIKVTGAATYNAPPEALHNFWTNLVKVAEIADLTSIDDLNYTTVFKTELIKDNANNKWKYHIVTNLVNPDNIG